MALAVSGQLEKYFLYDGSSKVLLKFRAAASIIDHKGFLPTSAR